MNYNQGEKLTQCINEWFNLPNILQPEEIIVVDDGSIDLPEEDIKGVRFIRLEHTRHIAKMANIGADACKTDWFIYWDPSHMITYQYISKQLGLSNKDEWYIPIQIHIKKKDSVDLIFTPIKVCVPITNNEFLPTGLVMMHKDTFLYYNEAYDEGIGRYDMDYNYRWLLAGKKVYYCSDMYLFHISHDRSYQTKKLVARNEFVYQNLLPKYKKDNITSLKKYINHSFPLNMNEELMWNTMI